MELVNNGGDGILKVPGGALAISANATNPMPNSSSANAGQDCNRFMFV